MSIPQTPSPLSNIIAAKTYNAAWFSGATKETQITAAIAAAALDGAGYVYVPANMYPYNAGAVTFNTSVRMIREGGEHSVYDIKAYGAYGDGVTNDQVAIQAALNSATVTGGIVHCPATAAFYLSTGSITLFANTPLRGEGMKTTSIHFNSISDGLVLQPPVYGTICESIQDIFLAGTIGTSLVGLNLKNCLFFVLKRVEITGFTSGNIVCLDYGQITLRDVFVGGGGDGTHPNVIFDTTVAQPGNSNGIYGYNFTISGGGASSVCGLRIERCSNANFYGGAIESAGVLVQISATNDGSDGKYCASINFWGTDFENPTGKYIEVGTAWNIGLGTIAAKQIGIYGCTGTLSGSTTAAFGVVLRLTQAFTSFGSNFILGAAGTAMFDLVSTVTGVVIGPCPNATLAGGIYIRSGGSSTGALITDTYMDGGQKTGDLNSSGGYRQSIDGWFQNNVAANQNNVALTRLATATEIPTRWIAPRSGSITCVWVKSDTPRTAGTLTMFVFKNNASVGFSAVLDGTNTTFKASTTSKDVITFVAGDEIDVRVNTDAGWLPITANIRAGIDIET